jgi:hypothetical protein
MIPDFQKIIKEPVGYSMLAKPNLTPGGPSTVFALDVLIFGGFITPYTVETSSYEQVHDNLNQALASLRKRQDSVTGGQRSVMLDVLAASTLEREAIMNSMDLIKKNYL